MTTRASLLDGSAPGWFLGSAVAINDKRWIAGIGYDPNLNQHAFLLTPVPEPSSALLLVIAASVGVAAHSRGTPRR